MATSAFSGSTLAAGEAGPSDWQNPSVAAMMHRLEGSSGHFVLVIVVTLLLISFTTRFYTSTYPGVKTSGSDGAKRVKMLPYWFPIIGHIFPLAFDPNKYMLGLKEKSSEGIIALNLGGTTHNIVFSPSIAKETFQQRSSHLNYSTIVWSVLHRVFGASLKMRHVYDKWLSEMNRLTMNTLLHGPHFATMVEETMRHMNEAIPNLVSFNHSLIDQSLWERVSHVALVETDDEDSQNGPVAEVNLFILLRDLMSHVAIPALMGSAFLEVFPTALQDMWELDNGFRWLSSGLPLWLPIPPLTRAHIARSRLKRAFAAYGRALDKFEAGIDPGPEWRDLDDVSALMKRRHSIWKESGLSPEARAPVDSTLLWA
ncbi:MAG: hypothetical protein M1837_000307 [Sclerophora amabilis]|nr:MAG: hypothetical protein M1837_000307 [Sclerophora amabilis]